MAYRLETPKPRPPPISTHFGDNSSLIYDLTKGNSVVSPTFSKSRVTSPASPSARSVRVRGSKRFKSPPPSASAAPSRALQSDLETFAEQCRSWYYNQDEEAGRLMTQTLTTLPSSQRPPFARLQASIRSGYHASVSARRNAEYQAHLSATTPGKSLTAHARLDPGGSAAMKERYERFEGFLRTWCTLGMPGTQPFFEGLWAVMRLSVVPLNLGGAGSHRIVWEIDDAVFKEAAGKDFMLEAINVLKGTLAFEEMASSRSRTSSVSNLYTVPPSHARAQSQPLLSNSNSPKSPPINATFAKRPRAPSDPFLDAPTPPLSRSLASSASSNNQISDIGDDASVFVDDIFVPEISRSDSVFENEPQMRIWTSPDISNPEYLALLKLFPAFVSARSLPRFPVSTTPKKKPDIEEGEEELGEEDRPSVRFGTGTIMLAPQERSDGWQGDWWTRFVMWWRTIFC